MKCNCGNEKGGTTFTSLYQGEYKIKAYDDYYARFKCHSCGKEAEANGYSQEWAELALERKWAKLMEQSK